MLFLLIFPVSDQGWSLTKELTVINPYNRLIARDVIAAMLVVWKYKIFLLWDLTSVFMQTM